MGIARVDYNRTFIRSYNVSVNPSNVWSDISIQIICIRHYIESLFRHTHTHITNINKLQNAQTTKYETMCMSTVRNIHLFVQDRQGLMWAVQVLLRMLRSSRVSIVTPMFSDHSYLNATLIRRTSGRNLGIFKKRKLFRKSRSTGQSLSRCFVLLCLKS